MDSSKLAVKFFAAGDPRDTRGLGAHEFVPVLHSWIQAKAVPDHLLIDVADYQHVHNGPGTVLVSQEANFYLDRGDGRLGLTYVRKAPLPGGLPDRLAAVFRAALEAVARLEGHPTLKGRLTFRTDEFVFGVRDRLLAPNTAETFAQVRPALEPFLGRLYGGAAVLLEQRGSPQAMFEVRAKAAQPPDVAALLRRLGDAVPANA